MGKTKTAIIDDSVAEEIKPQKTKRIKDDLVEKLKEELGGEIKETEAPKEVKKTKESKDKSKPRSKKYMDVAKEVDKNKTYPLTEAIELVKKLSFTKFESNLEIHINTIQTGLRGTVSLPFSGKTDYKTEAKAAVIHMTLGKLSQPTVEISANITSLLQTIGKTRVKKASLAPTMGPSVKLNLTSL